MSLGDQLGIWGLAISIVGLLVSIIGFALAIWQLVRTRKAAEAASAAASQAVSSVQFVNGVSSMQEIVGRSRNLLHFMREAKYRQSTVIAAGDLCELIARFRVTTAGKLLADHEKWEGIFLPISNVRQQMELAAAVDRLDRHEQLEMLKQLSDVHDQLSSFAAHTADSGATHANT